MKLLFKGSRILTLGHSAGQAVIGFGVNPVADPVWLELLESQVVKDMLASGEMEVAEGVAGAEAVADELTRPSSYSDLEKRNIELESQRGRDAFKAKAAQEKADADAKAAQDQAAADAQAKADADKAKADAAALADKQAKDAEIAQLDAVIADAGTTLEQKEAAAAKLQELTKG